MSWNYFHLAWCLSNVADSRCDLRAPLVPRLINHPFRWERESGRKRERESFGKCYRKGGGGHVALFQKLFLIVAVWCRQVSHWQRSKNKTLLIRLWKTPASITGRPTRRRSFRGRKVILVSLIGIISILFSTNYLGHWSQTCFLVCLSIPKWKKTTTAKN